MLEQLKCTNSFALVTAHHQDDRIETLIINLIRGTGRLGLSSLKETESIKRPFLAASKRELTDYAFQHNLSWREDSTNLDQRYLRNYIRLNVIPKLSDTDKTKLVAFMDSQLVLNQEIDLQLAKFFTADEKQKLRKQVILSLPYNESKELIASWLRLNNLLNFDHRTIERLTLAAKTKRTGTRLDVYNRTEMLIDKDFLALSTMER